MVWRVEGNTVLIGTMKAINEISYKNRSIISTIAAGALCVGGFVLFAYNYDNPFEPPLIILAVIGYWLSQENPRPRLLTFGSIFCIFGIIGIFIVGDNQFFYRLRYDPSMQTGTNVIVYILGVSLFFDLILLQMGGFILWGISILRSSSLPKTIGILIILAGIVAVASHTAGVSLGIAGIIWLITSIQVLYRAAHRMSNFPRSRRPSPRARF
jgi:hypothetical protein